MNGKFKNNGLSWGVGGMVGGVFVGLALVSIYGWTWLNIAFWLGFGLLIGAFCGVVSYMIYRAVQRLPFPKR